MAQYGALQKRGFLIEPDLDQRRVSVIMPDRALANLSLFSLSHLAEYVTGLVASQTQGEFLGRHRDETRGAAVYVFTNPHNVVVQ